MSLPSVEVLEAHHEFPCAYTFKVIGTAEGGFTGRVISCVRDELNLEADPPMSIRTTKSGNHVAITLEPVCETPQQVIAIYSRLTGMDGIVMLL